MDSIIILLDYLGVVCAAGRDATLWHRDLYVRVHLTWKNVKGYCVIIIMTH